MTRTTILAVLVVSMAATASMAERPVIEVTPEANYVWTSSLDATLDSQPPEAGKFDIKNNGAYGFTVDVEVRPGTQVEFLYLYQKSELTFDGGRNGKRTLYDLATSYYHVGAMQGFRRGKVLPFTGLTLGATSFDPSAAGETNWKFSIGLNAGAKVYLSERFGLRFHGRALMSFLDTGAGLWLGTGGVSMGITGYGIWQWDLGGGLVILL
jgi:hypothetical protein